MAAAGLNYCVTKSHLAGSILLDPSQVRYRPLYVSPRALLRQSLVSFGGLVTRIKWRAFGSEVSWLTLGS
jgi:hypothetical protein